MIEINNFHNENIDKLHLLGVYKITSKHNKLVYIGSTAKKSKYKRWSGFKLRWLHHISSLLNNKHSNIRLQRIVNKYGIEDLFFEIIEICDALNCIEREQYWIDYYNSFKVGLNLRPIAKNNLGLKLKFRNTEERSNKISKKQKENWKTNKENRISFKWNSESKNNFSKLKRKLSDEQIFEINQKLKLLSIDFTNKESLI